jgi:hypothetical protein
MQLRDVQLVVWVEVGAVLTKLGWGKVLALVDIGTWPNGFGIPSK